LKENAVDSGQASIRLLGDEEPAPVTVESAGARGPFLIVVDHAGRAVPQGLSDLGLPATELARHIAWDIGAAAVARDLGRRLNACVIRQTYSRLVIDCNRDPVRADSIVAASDGTTIPGNASLSVADRAARRAEVFDPYHAAIAAELDARAASGLSTVLVAVHSFTPVMAEFERPWRHGILHLGQSAFSRAVLARLVAVSETPVGDNEPYAMDDVDFTAPHHAIGRGYDYVELEINQALIGEAAGQRAQAAFLAPLLTEALADIGAAI
jgi:predicted N-formylglutamate amidohydrolase